MKRILERSAVGRQGVLEGGGTVDMLESAACVTACCAAVLYDTALGARSLCCTNITRNEHATEHT